MKLLLLALIRDCKWDRLWALTCVVLLSSQNDLGQKQSWSVYTYVQTTVRKKKCVILSLAVTPTEVLNSTHLSLRLDLCIFHYSDTVSSSDNSFCCLLVMYTAFVFLWLHGLFMLCSVTIFPEKSKVGPYAAVKTLKQNVTKETFFAVFIFPYPSKGHIF